MKLSEDSSSTSIYLEQIENHINLAEGYDRIRPLLFKQLNLLDGNHPAVDDKLADSIVNRLANFLNSTVNFHQSQKTYRTLQIITDLLTYAEQVMTPAMHNELFVGSLNNVALPKLVTFNSTLDMQCRNIAMGVIAFWYDKYARDENCTYDLFVQAFKYLKEKKLAIPQTITIKPVDTYKPKQKNESPQDQSQATTTQIILDEIEQFTLKTEQLFRENIKNIATTEYVRLIKHKSKVLFEFTQKGGGLSDKQKGKVKDCYKRLRVVLKEVDKYNQNKVDTKVTINQEQEYIEQKFTPKKSEKQIEPLSQKKSSKKQEESTQKVEVDLLGDPQIQAKVETKLQPVNRPEQAFNLLDFDISQQPKTEATPAAGNNSKKLSDFVDLLGESTPEKQPKADDQEEFVEGVLVETETVKTLGKEESNRQLEEVFSTPSKKQVSMEEESDGLAKQASNQSQQSNPDFNNEKQKDIYSCLDEVNLSHHSSNSQHDTPQKKQGLSFNLFGIFGNKQQKIEGQGALYDENNPYDYIPEALQKHKVALSQQDDWLTSSAPLAQPISLNTEIEVKAIKPVKAVDYSKYTHQISPHSDKDIDEDHAFEPNKPFQDLQEVEIEPPRKPSKKGDLLEENDD